ncbi:MULTISPECIES: hypothetical protein [unclassified Coleofasciculus]|nr:MULTISPECIES: hypothetical protein [unclassified Coleofasciculus]
MRDSLAQLAFEKLGKLSDRLSSLPGKTGRAKPSVDWRSRSR